MAGRGSFVEARANVTLNMQVTLGTEPTVVGVFGVYDTLRLSFLIDPAASISHTYPTPTVQVLAQDLAGGAAATVVNITAALTWEQTPARSIVLSIPGYLIDKVGTMGRSRGDDVSSPGLVLSMHV